MKTAFYITRLPNSSDFATKAKVASAEEIEAWLSKPKSRSFKLITVLEGEVNYIPKVLTCHRDSERNTTYYYVCRIDNVFGHKICDIPYETPFTGWIASQLIIHCFDWTLTYHPFQSNEKAPRDLVKFALDVGLTERDFSQPNC